MPVYLFMEPKRVPMTWLEFMKLKGPYSIALDGYVDGPPIIDIPGHIANFDHHKGVCRSATRAACGQVYYAIQMGLFNCFQDEKGILRIKVFLNHPDEDACMAWLLLKLGCFPIIANDKHLRDLVYYVDLIDSSAGSYPIDRKIWEEIAWIFQPYRNFRTSGEIDKQEADSYVAVVDQVELRIKKHLLGEGSSVPLDVRYELLGKRKLKSGIECAIIKEIGSQARIGLAQAKIPAYISVRERPDGNLTVTVGKTSPFVPIDLFKAYKVLNAAENSRDGDEWGGGSEVGGSPRVGGTKQSPDQIAQILESVS